MQTVSYKCNICEWETGTALPRQAPPRFLHKQRIAHVNSGCGYSGWSVVKTPLPDKTVPEVPRLDEVVKPRVARNNSKPITKKGDEEVVISKKEKQ